ncbi:tyrosine-protein phosphatase [Saccharopolyspora gloriosae]|uniref:Rhodanese-related sulfurtransferase n=1 Tax=Saccharopolyspora gloriosae TaxID=455344 RepID=A0A840N8C9_9PSEU|nr:tyrosine-protein phosphatase [Saccharopolyspora gloriosae]MBB5068230.1 rhodanese-related sulfurtransferase [Saccharopolyspora gloriosae]
MSTTDPTSEALAGLVNLRDLGGMPAGEGTTRAGIVLRSDAPQPGDREPEGITWPPRLVLDLRDASELNGTPHPLADVAEVHQIELLAGIHSTEVTHPLPVLYQLALRDAAAKLVRVFRLALEADGPVLVHCAAGKDRTGVVSAMLLSVAGVRSDAIIADYVRTDRNMFRVLQRLEMAPALPPGVSEEDVRELISTPVEAIEGVLESFAEHDEHAAGWLRAHGVTDEEIDRWREKFRAG